MYAHRRVIHKWMEVGGTWGCNVGLRVSCSGIPDMHVLKIRNPPSQRKSATCVNTYADKDVHGFTRIIAPVRRSRLQRFGVMRAQEGEGGDVRG
jgi:hypothetical protein